MTPQVLLLCSRRPIVSEFQLLAKTFTQAGLEPVFLCVRPGSKKFLKGMGSNALVVDLTGQEDMTNGEKAIQKAFGALRVASRLALRLNMRTLADFLATYEAVRQGQWKGRRFLRGRANVKAVLVADDRDIRHDAGFVKSARESGVPSIVVQFGRADAAADLRRRLSDPAYKGAGAIRSLLFGDNDMKEGPAHEPISFLSLGEYLAMKFAGAYLTVPWSYGGGNADRVAAIDAAEARKMIDAGVSGSKVFTTGQPSYDVLWSFKRRAADVRKKIFSEYGFDANKKMVVCALPVLGEHGMSGQSDQLVDSKRLFTLLRQSSSNVLISLHPRQRLEDYKDLAEDAGVAISRQPLREIIVAADLFVAYSSTLQWASLLGIPAIALEHYDLGYRLFDDLAGVEVLTQIEDLPELARSLLDIRRSDAVGKEPLDGQCCSRIVDLCKQAVPV